MSLDFAPLERYVHLNTYDPNEGKTAQTHLVSNRWLAEVLDVNYMTVLRWRKAGIPRLSADHAATRLGLHPAELWDDYWVGSALEVYA